MMRKIKRKILNKILSYLYCSIDENDIIVYNKKKGKLVLQGAALEIGNIRSLQSEIRTIRALKWWGLMTNEMKYIANKKMFEEARTSEDLIFGKAVLYTLDVMEKKMDKILEI